MGQYGNAAVLATECYLEGKVSSPRDAWDLAISRLTKSAPSSIKVCPRDAYLGLCERGLIRGIPAGKYGAPRNNRNGRYAVAAHQILQTDPYLAYAKQALWGKIPEPKAKNENNQMDVVLALWSGRMFV